MWFNRPSYPSRGSLGGRPQTDRSLTQPRARPRRFFVTAFPTAEKTRSADAADVATHRNVSQHHLVKNGSHAMCTCLPFDHIILCLPCGHTLCACLLAVPGLFWHERHLVVDQHPIWSSHHLFPFSQAVHRVQRDIRT